MIYYNLNEFQVLDLKLRWKIGLLEIIDIKQLSSFLSYYAHDNYQLIERLGTLFRESYIHENTLSDILQYINFLLTQFYTVYTNFNITEKQYIKFYILLMAIKGDLKYSDYIYNNFLLLPKLNSKDEQFKKIELSILEVMSSYYLYLNLPLEHIKYLIEEIINNLTNN